MASESRTEYAPRGAVSALGVGSGRLFSCCCLSFIDWKAIYADEIVLVTTTRQVWRTVTRCIWFGLGCRHHPQREREEQAHRQQQIRRRHKVRVSLGEVPQGWEGEEGP